MIEINSPQNPRVKRAVALRSARGRRQQQRILIEGARELHQALLAGVRVEEVFYDDDSLADADAAQTWGLLGAETERLRIDAAPVWQKLAVRGEGARLLAVAWRPQLQLAKLDLTGNPLLVVVEAVEKPGNLGAVFRAADAAGACAVLAADPVCDPFSPNCIRASLGAVFSTAAVEASSQQILQFLQQRQVQIVAARVDGEQLYWDVDLSGPTAIVLGSEAAGLSNAWRDIGILAARLPMRGRVDSLNVAATAGILLYEAVRQRQTRGQ